MMQRREFLRGAVTAGCVAAGGRLAGALGAEPKLEKRNERPAMKYARLGRTGLMVSRIGHGGQHTNTQRLPILAGLYEGGVNLFDTSHVYGGGRSEQAFGEFFGQGGRRKNVFISTKMDLRAEMKAGKGVYEKAMERADSALRRLRTDHVDIMILHGCTTLVDYVNNAEWLRAAEDLKKQGKVRFVGLSEHQKPAEVLKLAAASGRYDVAMVAFSLVKATWGSLGRTDVKSIEPAIKAARKADIGILAIKAASRAEQIVAKVSEAKLKVKGRSPYQLCYRYILDLPGVAAVVCGMSNMTHVAENLLVPGMELTARQAEHLRRVAAASGVCGFCGTCMDVCPNGIAVQDVLRFHGYHGHGYRAAARAAYASLPPERRADAC
ncbi:MAG: aldo/keto reductase, partial [Phycisphaerae bacterium]